MLEAWSRRDVAAASAAAREIIAQRADEPTANQILAAIALDAGDAATALAHLRVADGAAPNQPQILNMLGIAARRVGDVDVARAAFARAGGLGSGEAWRNLGLLENAQTRFGEALTAFERAVAAQPDSALAHASLAQALERKHDLARAKQHAEIALQLAPGNEVARLTLAQVKLRERDFADAEALLAPMTPRASVNAALAWGLIGEARDKAGAFSSAFAAFTTANQLLLALHGAVRDELASPYHPESIARMTRFMQHEDASQWLAPLSFDTPAPVFLVGFPRSGTTLLDQILSSHSRILCLEEQEHVAGVLGDLVNAERVSAVRDLSADEIRTRRARYWQSVAAGGGAAPDGRLVVDKLPLNIAFLPLIARIFPDARVIFALRDPRDVILSCYQQRFGMNAAMAQLLALDTAAAYYDAMMTLVETARARLGLLFHVVRYEDVVADVEAAAQGLTGFLGLSYEPVMRDFHATARARDIATPSARQVIEPIYAGSVGRWRSYAAELAPALPVLAPWAARFGYSP